MVKSHPPGFHPQNSSTNWNKGKRAAEGFQPQLKGWGPAPRRMGWLLLCFAKPAGERETPRYITTCRHIPPDCSSTPGCHQEKAGLHHWFTPASQFAVLNSMATGFRKSQVCLALQAVHCLSWKGAPASCTCIKQRHSLLMDPENPKSRLCSSPPICFINLGKLQGLSEKQEEFEWLLLASSTSFQMKTCRWKHLDEWGFVQLVVIWIILNTSSLFLPDFCCG